jgi:uncharacterized membrane protein
MDIKTISLWVMAIFYIAGGINHFANPKFYLKIMPPYLPYHAALNYISGLAEIVLGILLFIPEYTSIAAWGIILLLIAIFPANYYHYQKGLKKNKMVGALRFRLVFQIVFIAWAYWYA